MRGGQINGWVEWGILKQRCIFWDCPGLPLLPLGWGCWYLRTQLCLLMFWLNRWDEHYINRSTSTGKGESTPSLYGRNHTWRGISALKNKWRAKQAPEILWYPETKKTMFKKKKKLAKINLSKVEKHLLELSKEKTFQKQEMKNE